MLVIAVGCTGGHHRSVAVARALTEYISRLGYQATGKPPRYDSVLTGLSRQICNDGAGKLPHLCGSFGQGGRFSLFN